MADSVPFNPFPSVIPTEGMPGRERIDANVGAFGGLVGAAEQQGGARIEQGGRDLQAANLRAQETYNNTAASEMYNDMSARLADIHAHFLTLSPQQRMEQRESTNQAIEDVYQQGFKNARSDDMRRLYAQAGRAQTSRVREYVARAAAEGEKKWVDDVQETKVQTYRGQAQTALIAGNGSPKALQEFDEQMDHAVASRVDITRQQFGEGPLTQDEKLKLNQVALEERGAGVNGAVQALLRLGKVTEARQLYEKNKTIIDQSSQLTGLNNIHTVTNAINGQQLVDSAFNKSEPVAGIGEAPLSWIKNFEGYRPGAYWDFKQHSIGYGTRANSPNEVIDRPEAERRFKVEIDKAAKFVDSVNPNLDPGTRAAMTSLTYNAGTTWADQQLGQAIKAGDLNKAAQYFIGYNRAGGQVNSALVNRRAAEVAWFGQTNIPTAPIDRAKVYENLMEETKDNPQLQASTEHYFNQTVRAQDMSDLVQRRQLLIQQEQKKAASEAEEGNLRKDIVSGKPINAADVVNNPNLSIEGQNRTMAFMQRQNRPEPPSNQSGAVLRQITTRMSLPEGDPNKLTSQADIVDAFNRGDLSTAHYNFAMKKWEDQKNESGLRLNQAQERLIHNVAKPAIEGQLGDILNPETGRNMDRYMFDLDKRVQDLKAAGKDPWVVFDPNSTEYFGSAANLRKYQSNMSQALQAKAAESNRALVVTPSGTATSVPVNPESKQRQAGESFQQWLTRQGSNPFGAQKPSGPVVPQSR